MVSEGELVVLIRSYLWDQVVLKSTKNLLIQGHFFDNLKSPNRGIKILEAQHYFLW